MEKLFGIPMDTIMAVLLGAFIGVTVVVGIFALRNRMMLKLGLRNIPRRPSQTVLIVIGLTLATTIITSAFGTGDTITYTIRSSAVDLLGEIDETIKAAQSGSADSSDIRDVQYFSIGEFYRLREALQGYEEIDGLSPALFEAAPMVDVTSQQSKSRVFVFGLPSESTLFLPTRQDGQRAELSALGPNEVYLTEEAAKDLDAKPGDVLNLFASQEPAVFTFKGTVRKTGLPGATAVMVLPLDRAQNLFGREGQINRILVSNRGDSYGGVRSTSEVTRRLRTMLSDDATVTAIAAILSDEGVKAKLSVLRDTLDEVQQQKVTSVIAEIERGRVTDEFKSLLGDDGVVTQLRSLAKDQPNQGAADKLNTLLGKVSKLAVEDVKARNIDQAEQTGNAFTSVFVTFGLFSMAAGVLLIFLIFVMLAAERRPEMGMARAVGTKRRHLIQMFAFEGFAYDLVAAAVGVAAGVGVGYIMVGVLASAFGQGVTQPGFAMRHHFEIRSLVVSYCLGMLLTFITVTISAWRVSRLNIVAAIRDLPDVRRSRSGFGVDFAKPFQILANAFRNLFRLHFKRFLGDLLLRMPRAVCSFWWTLFKLGPLTILLGLLLVYAGLQVTQAFPFSLGVSLALLGLGLSVRWMLTLFALRTEVKDRVGFSLAGILIVAYWSLPIEALTEMGLPELRFGIEMFFLSGMMMVLGAVLTVIYNSDLFIGALNMTLGRLGHLTPVVKTAVAYPMSFKFRTGLTVAMFALVIFTMIVMSVLINTMSTVFSDREAMSGGYHIRGAVSYSNPIKDISAAFANSSKLSTADFETIGGMATLGIQVRQPGGNPVWQASVMQSVDDAFLDGNGFKLSIKAKGYENDREVWRALKENRGYAVIDARAVPPRNSTSVVIGGPALKLAGVYAEDKVMDPIRIEVRDLYAGRVTELTIIGVADPMSLIYGLFTSRDTLVKGLAYEVPPTTYFFKLRPGVDATGAVRVLGATFLQNGMEAKVLDEVIDEMFSSNLAINSLMQGFMSLGLLVGIAALGVISTRSVVERRQQIGMLRAIGYERGMVQLSFLLESSFTALLGILLGVGLGLILSYNLVGYLAKTTEGISFTMPWLQILLIIGIGYGASLLTTFLPARQAARVYPAEALRYE